MASCSGTTRLVLIFSYISFLYVFLHGLTAFLSIDLYYGTGKDPSLEAQSIGSHNGTGKDPGLEARNTVSPNGTGEDPGLEARSIVMPNGGQSIVLPNGPGEDPSLEAWNIVSPNGVRGDPGLKGWNIVSPNGTGGDLGLEVENSTVRQRQQPTCWIFSHLQKSGGSSVKKILKDGCNYCKMFTYDVPNWCGKTVVPTYSIGQHGKTNVIAGGYTEALRFDPKFNDCAWFTMFRDPIPRLVSAFFYCKRFPEDRCCGTKQMPDEARHDITAFAKHWGNFAVRQFAMGLIPSDDVFDYFRATKGPEYQCKKDSGWYWLKLYLEEKSTFPASITHEEGALYGMLHQIKDLLTEQFTAIGILEEFNSSISLFDAALRIPGLNWRTKFFKYGVKNSGHANEEEKKLIAESRTNSELKNYIYLDIILYEHAVNVFRQQARFHGVD